MYVNLRSKDI